MCNGMPALSERGTAARRRLGWGPGVRRFKILSPRLKARSPHESSVGLRTQQNSPLLSPVALARSSVIGDADRPIGRPACLRAARPETARYACLGCGGGRWWSGRRGGGGSARRSWSRGGVGGGPAHRGRVRPLGVPSLESAPAAVRGAREARRIRGAREAVNGGLDVAAVLRRCDEIIGARRERRRARRRGLDVLGGDPPDHACSRRRAAHRRTTRHGRGPGARRPAGGDPGRRHGAPDPRHRRARAD